MAQRFLSIYRNLLPRWVRRRWINREAKALRLRDERPYAAVAIFERILRRQPDRIPLLRACARLLTKLGEYQSAETHWKRIREIGDPEIEAPLQLARLYYKTRRYSDCVEQAERVLELLPSHAEADRLMFSAARAISYEQSKAGQRPRRASRSKGWIIDPDENAEWAAEIEDNSAAGRQNGNRAQASVSSTHRTRQGVRDVPRDKETIRQVEQFVFAGNPLSDLPPALQRSLVSVLKKAARRELAADYAESLEQIAAALAESGQTGVLVSWALAAHAMSVDDRINAARHLDEAITFPPPPLELDLDLRAERALFFARYNRYSEALTEANLANRSGSQTDLLFQRKIGFIEKIAQFCEGGQEPLRYPECIIDVIVREVLKAPRSYQPRAGHVAMISGSLGPGGSERQLVNISKQLAFDKCISALSLFVRSVHLRVEDRFFLDEMRKVPVELNVYGQNWYSASSASVKLAELASQPRLQAAINLLPPTLREDVIRLCRLYHDERPQVVHIWQDMASAALAAFIMGVPRYFVRRGSLSPDHWEHNEYRLETSVRPTRHIYRRLLEHSDFSILNNSAEGSRTDIRWTGSDDKSRFKVMRNALDTENLSSGNLGKDELRRRFNIPVDAPVVGGVFRFVTVKRPLMWLDAAMQVANREPRAHFIIVGDGPLLEDVRRLSLQHGFSDRLHLPGNVTNVADWYKVMDVLLLTSSREGIPNVVLEAQYFGVPVVATDVGGVPEALWPGKTGFVVPGQSAEQYSAKIIEIISSPDWLAAANKAARPFVEEHFGVENVIADLVEYYDLTPPS